MQQNQKAHSTFVKNILSHLNTGYQEAALKLFLKI